MLDPIHASLLSFLYQKTCSNAVNLYVAGNLREKSPSRGEMADALQQNPTAVNMAPVELPAGNNNVLLRVSSGATELSLICGFKDEHIRTVRLSELSITAVMDPQRTLAMLFCNIGRHHWPLGKDCVALRVGPRRFCFSLPGLLFGMTLPDGCGRDELWTLQRILNTFCTYQDHSGEEDSEFCTPKPDRNFWASAFVNIIKIVTATNDSLGESNSEPAPEVEVQTSRGLPMTSRELLRRRLHTKFHRVHRFSTVTKLVSRALLAGIIDPSLHAVIRGPGPSQSSSGGRVAAMASVRTVSDVVDVADPPSHLCVGSPMPQSNRRFPQEDETFWVLNGQGMTMFGQAVAIMSVVKAAIWRRVAMEIRIRMRRGSDGD